MEQRHSKRVIVDMDAMLISRSLNYKGVIINFADDGICMNVDVAQNLCQLLNGMLFEVKFELFSGETINLQCEVIRTHRKTADSPENMVGMKIINQPPEYRAFIENLH